MSPVRSGRTGFPWTIGTPIQSLSGNYPRISIVTPSYQQGEFLEETIRSVLLQGYPNLEYFVMDGGSTDQSRNILETYAPYLSGWVSQKDGGQTDAINQGFVRSSGEIMGYLNSDDLLLPGALLRVAEAFMDEPSRSFVTGFRKIINEQSQITGNYIRDPITSHYLRYYCNISQETTFWRRSAWQTLGSFDDSFQFAMDYEYWLRALQAGYTFHLIPHYLGAFRDYAANKTRSQRETYFREMTRLYHRYQLGDDQAAIEASLGPRWRPRYNLYEVIGHTRWSNDPRRVMAAWRALETPLVCDIVLTAWAFGQGYQAAKRDSRPFHSRLKQGIIQVKDYLKALTINTEALLMAKSSRDVCLIRDAAADTLTDRHSANEIVFGSGWHPLERYETINYRWCRGQGKFAVLNGDGLPHTLRLSGVAPNTQSESFLELCAENGDVLACQPIKTAEFEWCVPLPQIQAEITWYELRWQGERLAANDTDKRERAFHLTEVGWDSPAAVAQDSQRFLQQRVIALLNQPCFSHLPLIGKPALAIQRWRLSHRAMTAQTHLWETLAYFERDTYLKIERVQSTINQRRIQPRFRCVIDCSTYYMNNNGDKAMLHTLVRRIRDYSPDALISVITNDPDGIAEIDPTLEAIPVGNRALWQPNKIWLDKCLPEQLPTVFQVQNAIRRASSRRYWGLVRSVDEPSSRGGAYWQWRIHAADAVFLMGGGYYTDAFAHHAVALMTTLEEGIATGKPAFIVGCGFEPASDEWLTSAAREVLPRLNLIGCREGLVSPALLEQFGVEADRYRVTGDDAIQLAYETKPDGLGEHIGVNIRNHSYNSVTDAQIAALRQALLAATATFDAPLISLPISNYQPSDAQATREVLHDMPVVIDRADALDTPARLFEAVRTCRIVVTGSYHAAVFALAMGIPAICLYASSHYQHKMTGLLTMFGGQPFAASHSIDMGAPDLTARLAAMITAAWQAAPSLRPVLLEAAQRQIRLSTDFYTAIFEEIDRARAQPSAPQASMNGLRKEDADQLLALYVKMIQNRPENTRVEM